MPIDPDFQANRSAATFENLKVWKSKTSDLGIYGTDVAVDFDLCVGDGAARYQDEICEGYRCEISGPMFPSVGTLVLLSHARALREEWVRPDEIEPIYLRAPDAQINWAVREARP